jgi:hypothetical protein
MTGSVSQLTLLNSPINAHAASSGSALSLPHHSLLHLSKPSICDNRRLALWWTKLYFSRL